MLPFSGLKIWQFLLCLGLLVCFSTDAYGDSGEGEVSFTKGEGFEKDFRTDSALFYFREALEVFESQGNKSRAVDCCIKLGTIFSYSREPEKALLYCQRGIKHNRSQSNEEAGVLYHLTGMIYKQLGKIPKAKQNLYLAEKLVKENLGTQSVALAQIYQNLERIALIEGNKSLAAGYREKALEIRIARNDTAELIVSYVSLGESLASQGNTDEAIVYYHEAEKFCATRPDMRARVYYYLTSLFNKVGDYDSALVYIGKAKPLFRQLRLEEELLPATTLNARIYLNLFEENQKPEYLILAFNSYEESINVVDSLRLNLEDESSKLLLTRNIWRVFEGSIQTAIRLYEIDGNSHWAEQVFRSMEKSKGFLLLESMLQSQAQLQLPDSLRNTENRLKRERNACKLIRKRLMEGGDLNEEEENCFKLDQAYEQLIRQIEKNYPTYYNIRYNISTTSFKEIQELCSRQGSGFLEFFWGKEHFYLFFVDEHRVGCKSFPISDELLSDVSFIYQSLRNSYSSFAEDSALFEASQRMYGKLIAGNFSPEVQKLIIATDGPLASLPFESLIADTSKAAVYREGYWKAAPFLAKTHVVQYIQSATVLAKQKDKKKHAGRGLLAFAPVYTGIDSLFRNQEEAAYSAELFKGSLYTGKEASEAGFKLMAEEYGVLHLVMHGLADDLEPLNSHLLFSKDSLEGEDGRLTTNEIYGLNLNASLAVLSACETGKGKLAKGEGLQSLSRAFAYAGCPSVMLSLWKADERFSGDIVQAFFSYLKNGADKSEALSRSKAEFLAQTSPEGAHPRNWATFILIGDDTRIRGGSGPTMIYLFGGVAILLALFVFTKVINLPKVLHNMGFKQ